MIWTKVINALIKFKVLRFIREMISNWGFEVNLEKNNCCKQLWIFK
jgi:hypothetical protein